MSIVFSYLSGKHTVSTCFELEDMIKLGEDFSSLSVMYGAKMPGLVVLLDNIDFIFNTEHRVDNVFLRNKKVSNIGELDTKCYTKIAYTVLLRC